MTSRVTVSLVASAADHRAFCDLPYQLYRSDPRWSPPLRSAERARWSPRKNPSLHSRWCRRYIARVGHEPVGRVAGIIDAEFCRRWDPDTAFCGFFECRNDREIAVAMMSALEQAVSEQGKCHVLGPINLTTHDEVGLLVSGFDAPPMVLSPYNPDYYETLFTACGFTPLHDYLAFQWSPASRCSDAVPRWLRRSARSDVRIRSLDPRRYADDNRTLWSLYNSSFEHNWGFVPLSWEEYLARARNMRAFYRPEHVAFAEVEGHPVGFALTLPNILEALAGTDGRWLPFHWLRLPGSIRRIRGLRLILLGVVPDFRGRGVAVLLAAHQLQAALRDRAPYAELSLVQDSNRHMRHVIDAFGGKVCKTVRLFEKWL